MANKKTGDRPTPFFSICIFIVLAEVAFQIISFFENKNAYNNGAIQWLKNYFNRMCNKTNRWLKGGLYCNNIHAIIPRIERLIAFVLLYCALWLVNKTRATFSINEKLKQNQSWQSRTYFLALLGAGYMHLLRILIDSLRYLRVL